MANDLQAEDHTTLELIGRAQTGDADAFGSLAARVHARIHRWALSQTGDRDDADDVAQAVLLKLHRHLRTYAGGARFTTWLYRVTQNAATDLQRKQRRRPASNDERTLLELAMPTEEDTAGTLQTTHLAQLVHTYFRELPDRQRVVFDLADLQGFTPSAIAEMMDMQPVTVRANLFKARRAIRARMLANHPELLEEYST